MKKVLLTCFFCIIPVSLFAMQPPKFSELTHDELTALWRSDYYEALLAEGESDCCLKIKQVLGQKGCFVFGEAHAESYGGFF